MKYLNNAYLFIPLALCAASTLFPCIAPPLGQEVIRGAASVLRATYHHALCSDMEDRDAAANDEAISRELRDYGRRFAWFRRGGLHSWIRGLGRDGAWVGFELCFEGIAHGLSTVVRGKSRDFGKESCMEAQEGRLHTARHGCGYEGRLLPT